MHKKLSSKDGLKIIFGWVLPEGPVYDKKFLKSLRLGAELLVEILF
jgi:hypothetical protein